MTAPAPAAREWTLDSLADRDGSRRARQFAAEHTARFGRAISQKVELLVSELAGNAYVHGAPPVVLRLGHDGAVLRIEVSDGGDGDESTIAPRRSGDVAGWGLALVDTLADVWGVRVVMAGRARAGVVVWFEVAAVDTAADQP